MKYILSILGSLAFFSCSSDESVKNTYQINHCEPIVSCIDSIWNEVMSWDKDTSQLIIKKREQYALDLENLYLNTEKAQDARDKALSYSLYIRSMNKDTLGIINTFERYSDTMRPLLWNQTFPVYNTYIKYVHNDNWIQFSESLVQEQKEPLKKSVVWNELGLHYFFRESNKTKARQAFQNILKYEDGIIENNLLIEIPVVKSFLRQIDSLQLGQQAPAFCSTDIQGEEFCIKENNDKITLLIFTAAWCGPCREEQPKLQSIYKKYESRSDFQMISISRDFDLEKMNAYIEKNNIKWPYIFEGYKKKGKLTLLYNALSIPLYYVIDKNGIMQYNYDARQSEISLEEVLVNLLETTKST